MERPEFQIIEITESNIEEYGLLCQKSKKKEEGYQNKIKWIEERFREGMKYQLLLVEERGKMASRGFIEYTPGEYCWRGIEAKEYMVIHCIWVVGRIKGFGFGSKLLEKCLKDAEGMNGVAVVTAKTTWLPNSKFFIKHGFELADTFPPSFELYVKRFDNAAALPTFTRNYEERRKQYYEGFTAVYSHQCPYTPAMVRAVETTANNRDASFNKILIDNCRYAQKGIHPYGTSCYLLNGEIITYHSDKLSRLLPED
ncbi:MAG: N-acetyltransferase family protein [Candidatus Heimdallarchaeaceae archaeon]|jgi:N-acetylglutamate synthase-like GNAT family acetyltransferase